MTKQEKQLLLKDLCARLLYHPRVRIYNDSWEGCKIGEFDNDLWFHHVEAFNCSRIEMLPYLRSMSSMTKEEREFMEELSEFKCTPDKALRKIDFYLEHHIDFRGLIPKGLALEATEEMYKFD